MPTPEPRSMTRDEWVNELATAAKRYRVSMAIAGHEQSALTSLVREALADGELTESEIQSVLIVRGPAG